MTGSEACERLDRITIEYGAEMRYAAPAPWRRQRLFAEVVRANLYEQVIADIDIKGDMIRSSCPAQMFFGAVRLAVEALGASRSPPVAIVRLWAWGRPQSANADERCASTLWLPPQTLIPALWILEGFLSTSWPQQEAVS